MNKQVQKQVKKNIESSIIDKKVERLVKIFNDLQEEYIEKSRGILLKIIDLRRIQNKKYSYDDLCNEDGLQEHREKIRYFVKWDDINKNTYDKQLQGKIKSSEIMLIAQLPKKMLRDNQDEIVEKVIKGEITKQDLIEASPRNLYSKLGNEYKAMEEENAELLNCIYEFTAIENNLRRATKLKWTEENKKLLKERFESVQELVGNILGKKYKQSIG